MGGNREGDMGITCAVSGDDVLDADNLRNGGSAGKHGLPAGKHACKALRAGGAQRWQRS